VARRPYVSTYFSPNRGAADVVIGFIDRCSSTIDAAVYSVTHDGIAAALIRAHHRGVRVRLLMDKAQAGSKYADDEHIAAAGVPVRRDTQSGLMHTKYMVGDGKAVASGSFNWTKGADMRNVETFNIMRLSYVVKDFAAHFKAIWADNEAGAVTPTP
tara:strand:+ start:8567 stop:9037 length:471 start_codon:yes stop_codon:yes gene_type:complete